MVGQYLDGKRRVMESMRLVKPTVKDGVHEDDEGKTRPTADGGGVEGQFEDVDADDAAGVEVGIVAAAVADSEVDVAAGADAGAELAAGVADTAAADVVGVDADVEADVEAGYED